ncbi:hypothetical protein T440DRAFT_493382 [Plenodomus tracheiphilus IPT5]|uniref:Peptidase S54 rhomboid domain-containing protein n=1 Tax=Plenodomus tracheiphilus IPT5 TaxID=1408161 RepID=A0A6A7ASV5_9PLEO|nr:hypothetical protein T440DRAFT_493382 [Plenodomus tracheiphilus IPT5]
MSLRNLSGPSLRLACFISTSSRIRLPRLAPNQSPSLGQWRNQHNRPRRPLRSYQPPTPPQPDQPVIPDTGDGRQIPDAEYAEFPQVRVRYLRPAIWALTVSGGIFTGLAYLEANKQIESQKRRGWLQVPQVQWSVPRQKFPTPTEVATTWWKDLNEVSKLSAGLVGINAAVHVSSFVVPRFWYTLWHLPARNVNYTQFTSMFVHSGAMHIAFNMYALSNFMPIAGNTRLFEGNSYHLLSFYLSTGLISGFAQHLATLIPPSAHRKAIPEIFIRCGGASGALFGILSVFCMQYPTAGLGLIFLPFSMEAQYFLPVIMLFDFVGMVRGYSFINLGHAAHLSGAAMGIAYSHFDGKTNLWNPLVRFWNRQLQKQS